MLPEDEQLTLNASKYDHDYAFTVPLTIFKI